MPHNKTHRATSDSRQSWILTVVFIYATSAATWIFFSDRLLGYWVTDPVVIVTFSLYKGWFFVFVTAVLLYWLLSHQQKERASAKEQHQRQAAKIKDLYLFSAIADASLDAIYAKDLEGRYVLFNPASSRTVGKPQSDVIGKDDHEIFPHHVAEEIKKADQKAIRNRQLITIEDDIITPEGPRTFLTIKGPLIDAHNNVIGSFGISRDISERKETEKILQESEARFRSLFDNIALGITILDANTAAVIESNKMAKTQSGFAMLVAHRTATQHTPHGLADAMQWIHRAAQSGSQHFEWKTINGFGQATWEDVLLHKIELNNEQLILAVTADITTTKFSEEELRRHTRELAAQNRELERFNSAMIGRELAMIELKNQINELAKELGRTAPYPTTPHMTGVLPRAGLRQ